jgi:hypothetical protein
VGFWSWSLVTTFAGSLTEETASRIKEPTKQTTDLKKIVIFLEQYSKVPLPFCMHYCVRLSPRPTCHFQKHAILGKIANRANYPIRQMKPGQVGEWKVHWLAHNIWYASR